MLNGLYTATSGMAMQQKRMDIIASNLANINTVGHKKEIPVFSEYIPNKTEHTNDIIRDSDYNKMINSTVRLHDIKVSFEQGYLKETGQELDMALGNPKAFFAVDTPFGIRFTRDGSFTTNDRNELTTMEGYNIVSNINTAQAVRIPEGAVVTEEGDILVDGAPIGAIDILEFEDTANLQKSGKNLYIAVDALPQPAENPGLITGYLEGSNVNPIDEMVRMIEASRGFESYSKIIASFETMNAKAVNEVGVVR
ncbi:MAG: flagellar biosynthesis protein FlgG [Denitrovibrio sp.]|nr:MAG: flagellar biosynthesis protein FlgG [Denitrovibrio sp.]